MRSTRSRHFKYGINALLHRFKKYERLAKSRNFARWFRCTLWVHIWRAMNRIVYCRASKPQCQCLHTWRVVNLWVVGVMTNKWVHAHTRTRTHPQMPINTEPCKSMGHVARSHMHCNLFATGLRPKTTATNATTVRPESLNLSFLVADHSVVSRFDICSEHHEHSACYALYLDIEPVSQTPFHILVKFVANITSSSPIITRAIICTERDSCVPSNQVIYI